MLSRKKKYLQVALNSSLAEAINIVDELPVSDRIIIEAGTPLIKEYGSSVIRQIQLQWAAKLRGTEFKPYVVADLKCMDRGEREVKVAKLYGASAAVVLGQAPLETVNSFIENCRQQGVDSMVDMMNVEQPIKILRKLKNQPNVVILHRGVDEEQFNKNKPIPYVQINKIRATVDVMISIAGGDTVREVQRAIFNDADIVVVWKSFYQGGSGTGKLAEEFLAEIK